MLKLYDVYSTRKHHNWAHAQYEHIGCEKVENIDVAQINIQNRAEQGSQATTNPYCHHAVADVELSLVGPLDRDNWRNCDTDYCVGETLKYTGEETHQEKYGCTFSVASETECKGR